MKKNYHDHGNLELLNHIPDHKQCEKVADVFMQICDATRLRILYLLCHSTECVQNVAAAVEMSAPAVSHHLKILKQAGIIVAERKGKEMYYSLAQTKEAKLVHQMIDDIFHIKCK